MKKIEDTKLKNLQQWLIFILIILNIIVFVFISNKIYFRLDLTEGQKYSLSKASRDLLKKLDSPLIIEYYYNNKSKEVKDIAQVIQYVTDMLKEYENSGKGYVNVLIKELNYNKPQDQALIAELEQQGLQTVAVSESGETESKSMLGLSGIIIKYKNEKRVLGAIFSDVGFEFKLDIEIKKLIGDSKEVIGIYTAFKDKTLDKDFKYVKQYIEKEYKDVRYVTSGAEIPNDVTTLLILGGESLTDWDLFQIDQYFMNGGKGFIAASGVNVIMNMYGIYGIPADNKLLTLLSSYGITINRDLIADNESFNPVIQGFMKYNYPLWIKVKKKNFNNANPIIGDLERINLLWASSIKIDDKIKSNSEYLLRTTNAAKAQTQDYKVDLESYRYLIKEGGTQYDLSVTFTGKVESFFKDKEVPKKEGSTEQFTGTKLNNGNTKLIVVGCDTFLQTDYIGNDELIFLLNGIDWLSKDSSLIKIRSKGKFSKPLDKARDQQQFDFYKNIIIGFTTYLLPLLFIIFGIILNLIRINKNKKMSELYLNKNIKKEEGEK